MNKIYLKKRNANAAICLQTLSFLFVSIVTTSHLDTIIEALVAMGYNRQEIEASLSQVRYDDVFATYLLLGRKSTDVSRV